jgi:hypothetical protein
VISTVAFKINLRRYNLETTLTLRQGRVEMTGDQKLAHGRAVQVDPIKVTLKAPGIKQLKP